MLGSETGLSNVYEIFWGAFIENTKTEQKIASQSDIGNLAKQESSQIALFSSFWWQSNRWAIKSIAVSFKNSFQLPFDSHLLWAIYLMFFFLMSSWSSFPGCYILNQDVGFKEGNMQSKMRTSTAKKRDEDTMMWRCQVCAAVAFYGESFTTQSVASMSGCGCCDIPVNCAMHQGSAQHLVGDREAPVLNQDLLLNLVSWSSTLPTPYRFVGQG